MHSVASVPVAYLLITIGLCLLLFEFFTAGIGVAGVVGAACTVLGCYGLLALPTRGLGGGAAGGRRGGLRHRRADRRATASGPASGMVAVHRRVAVPLPGLRAQRG